MVVLVLGLAVLVYAGSVETNKSVQAINNLVFEDSKNNQVTKSTSVANGGFLFVNVGGGMGVRNSVTRIDISSSAWTTISPTDNDLMYSLIYTTYTAADIEISTSAVNYTDFFTYPKGNAPTKWLSNLGLWLRVTPGLNNIGTVVNVMRTYKY